MDSVAPSLDNTYSTHTHGLHNPYFENGSSFFLRLAPCLCFAAHCYAKQEGIYGWAAVNFLRGNLLSLSQGAGTVDVDTNMTVGTLDLGGASTQISFFKTDQVANIDWRAVLYLDVHPAKCTGSSRVIIKER